MHTALQAQRNKTDHDDACGVAQLLRSAWYRDVDVRIGAATATDGTCY